MADRPIAFESLWTGPGDDPKRYRVDTVDGVLEPIGDGGEGIVFAAVTQTGDGERRVALKMLTAVPPDQYEALAARSRAIATVAHPGLMRQLEVFVGTGLVADEVIASSDADVLYSAAEWVPGVPLVDAMAGTDTATALEWVAQIADAVDALHHHHDEHTPEGIVHRDVKPSNIRVTPDGHTVLIDFGIARPHDDLEYTKASGTFGWRPPELLGGPGTPGPPIDTWGVGAIAYWVVLGVQPPLEEAGAARIRLTAPLREQFGGDGLPLAAHISVLLEADPAKRPTDLTRWASHLRGLLSGEVRRRRRLTRTISAVTVMLVIAGGAAVGARLLAGDESPPKRSSGLIAGGTGQGARANQLDSPSGLAVDARMNLYVADTGNDRVQRWSPDAKKGVTVAGPGAVPGLEDSPWGVVTDTRNSVYVADVHSNRIRRWWLGGKTRWGRTNLTVAGGNGRGAAPNQFDGPYHFFVKGEPPGNTHLARETYYVSDLGNDRVQRWQRRAKKGVTVAGGNGPGAAANQLNDPGDVVVDRYGQVYVLDVGNDRVQRWSRGATEGVTVARGWVGQSWLDVDGAGNVYFGDQDARRVLKWAPAASEAVTVAGGNGTGSAPNQLSVQGRGTVDADGNVYVVDAGNDRIQKWAPGATEGVTVAGGNGKGSAPNQLNGPSQVVVDDDGTLYVADWYNSRVQRWKPGAKHGVTVAGGNGAGSAPNQLNRPTQISVTFFGGVVYVFDGPNKRVQEWSAQGDRVASEGFALIEGDEISGTKPLQIISADWLTVDATGQLFLTDAYNSRVQRWVDGAIDGVTVAGGNGQGTAANQLKWPAAAAIDAAGNVYVADSGNDRVQKWAPGAKKGITVAGGNGKGAAASQLDWPVAVDIDSSGNVYVADSGNHRVQKWAPGAKKGITVAGGNGKGVATNQLDNPTGVCVDQSGNVYVLDKGNRRVQEWSPLTGKITTVFGGQGTEPAFFVPGGLTMDTSGNLYVSDVSNGTVWLRSSNDLLKSSR